MRNFWLFALLLLTPGCREHTLDDGVFDLQPGEVLRDDCGLATAGVVGALTLRTEGHQVSLTLARPELRLVGTYLDGLEQMTLDGSLSNFSTVLRGRECLLDTVSFHLDGETKSPTTFTGAMSINYEARVPDECVCRFWFQYAALRR